MEWLIKCLAHNAFDRTYSTTNYRSHCPTFSFPCCIQIQMSQKISKWVWKMMIWQTQGSRKVNSLKQEMRLIQKGKMTMKKKLQLWSLSCSQCWLWQSNCQSAWLVVHEPDPQSWWSASSPMIWRDKLYSYSSVAVTAYTALIEQNMIPGRVQRPPFIPL